MMINPSSLDVRAILDPCRARLQRTDRVLQTTFVNALAIAWGVVRPVLFFQAICIALGLWLLYAPGTPPQPIVVGLVLLGTAVLWVAPLVIGAVISIALTWKYRWGAGLKA